MRSICQPFVLGVALVLLMWGSAGLGCNGEEDVGGAGGDSGPRSDTQHADGGEHTDVPEDTSTCPAGRILGSVRRAGGGPVSGARVTLLSRVGEEFLEARTTSGGEFAFSPNGTGSYELGASAIGLDFDSRSLELDGSCRRIELELTDESRPGEWTDLGDAGETLGGTDAGVLLPTGEVLWCHNTQDPIIFDPVTNTPAPTTGSGRVQGCFAVSVEASGDVLFVGGTDREIYGPGRRMVTRFDPVEREWTWLPHESELQTARWYPSMAPLPNGGFVVAGGGTEDNPERTITSEVFDPETETWSLVDNIEIGAEVSPMVLLYTGEVLMTHRPPQLYSPSSQQWRLATDFVQSGRNPDGDHADHELVLLPDGRVAAFGYRNYDAPSTGQNLELYDPEDDEWQLGPHLEPSRHQASTILLPDGRVLVMGGEKLDEDDTSRVNRWGWLALTDLYDPAENSWRRLAEMTYPREYHAVPVVVPDGRVIIAGGEGQPGQEPEQSFVEAFSPPYMFRGPRPRITSLSSETLTRGEQVSVGFEHTNAPTAIVLLGTVASTHFMDSGSNRYLSLDFSVEAGVATAQVPAHPARALFGYYILFVMVDDIPSEGRVVRIAPD